MAVSYQVNLDDEGRLYPHYWELCVGSCHAATILREDVRRQIRKAHRDIGFQYLRFHGLFDDDMSVVIDGFIPGMGQKKISFFNIDRVFDFLLDTGMKPFVEIGFMPEALASGTQTCFHYKGNVTMPAKDEEWQDLIRQFAAHLLERYGADEVHSWFFEVWNEPNLNFFFDGTQEDYFHLYEITAQALKEVDSKLKVGGPATSNNMWIPQFRAFCEGNGVPLDFITTHHYPSDDPLSTQGMNGPGTKGAGFDKAILSTLKENPEKLAELVASFTNRENNNPRDILFQLAKKARAEAGDYPLYYTEWNCGHWDTSYAAAGVTQVLSYNEGLVEGYSYWCVSDIFEEMGLNGLPFNNEFGLVNIYGTPKPVYRLFQTMHTSGDRRLPVTGDDHRTAEVLALAKEDEVTLFVYNHDIEERDIKAEEMEITVKGAAKRVQKAVIDSTHTNPFGCWQEMGSPQYPTGQQLAAIRNASQLIFEDVAVSETDSQVFSFTAEPESVTIFRITKAADQK